MMNERRLIGCMALVFAVSLFMAPRRAVAQDEFLDDQPDIESMLKPDAVSRAMQSFLAGDHKQSIVILNDAIAADKKNRRALLLRAEIQSFLGNHKASLADFTAAIALDPQDVEAINARGSEHFVLGQIEKAVADFDRFVQSRPKEAPSHWKRGIALYYVGRYRDGQRQFEQYQTVAQDDVENAVWKFLCQARGETVDAARRDFLKISGDTRVPMREIYRLFAGELSPDAVLAAAEESPKDDKDLNARLFYAHLYIGLYYEAVGDAKEAAKHLIIAARDHKITHFMWDVARVHARLLVKGGGLESGAGKRASTPSPKTEAPQSKNSATTATGDIRKNPAVSPPTPVPSPEAEKPRSNAEQKRRKPQ